MYLSIAIDRFRLLASQDVFGTPGSCGYAHEQSSQGVEAALATVRRGLDCGLLQTATSLHGDMQAMKQMACAQLAEIVERWQSSSLLIALQQRDGLPAAEASASAPDAARVARASLPGLQISAAGLACCG